MSIGGFLQLHKKLSIVVAVLLLITVAGVAVGVYWYPTIAKKYQQVQEQQFVSQLVIKTPDQMPAGMPGVTYYWDVVVSNGQWTATSAVWSFNILNNQISNFGSLQDFRSFSEWPEIFAPWRLALCSFGVALNFLSQRRSSGLTLKLSGLISKCSGLTPKLHRQTFRFQ
jgi:hypothetical protein